MYVKYHIRRVGWFYDGYETYLHELQPDDDAREMAEEGDLCWATETIDGREQGVPNVNWSLDGETGQGKTRRIGLYESKQEAVQNYSNITGQTVEWIDDLYPLRDLPAGHSQLAIVTDDGSSDQCLYMDGQRWDSPGETEIYGCDLYHVANGRLVRIEMVTAYFDEPWVWPETLDEVPVVAPPAPAQENQ